MQGCRGTNQQMSSGRIFCGFILAFILSACSSSWNKELPSSTELSPPRNYQIARSIIHLHTPYSWDACDQNGTVNGVAQEGCLSDLRDALCQNRIDFAFLTDHPSHMAEYEWTKLLLYKDGDTLLPSSSVAAANQISCSGSTHTPILLAGYEDQLMTIGMTGHLETDVDSRMTQYSGNTSATTISRLKTEVDGIVIVPHTESRTSDKLDTLATDGIHGIEIYNLHANLDPKIRHQYLGLDYLDGVIDFMVYWLDPYQMQEPDLAFSSFLTVSDVYGQAWNRLISAGHPLVGVAGSDSHQNVLPWKTRDGQRLDAHRRLLRWFSNHFLVTEKTTAAIKAAIRAARGWVVFEGLGTPVGMDFHATTGSTTLEVGESGAFVAGSTYLNVTLPTLHSASPQKGSTPKITLRIKKISGTSETVVATASNTSLSYSVTEPGYYRAEVSIIPYHLDPYLGFKKNKLLREMIWIITNHIHLT